MWWQTDRQQPSSAVSRRQLFKGLAVTAASLSLAGCGFKPMYGGGSSSSVTAQLGQVEIARINDRNGQLLRNALEQRFERSNNRARKIYILEITLDESINELGLAKDSFATRADMILDAKFKLTFGKQILLSGQTQGVASYNILDQQYATVVSAKDARERALNQIADDLTRRVSSYFSQHPTPPAQPPASAAPTAR